MKKGYYVIIVLLVISMSFVSASKVYSRAKGGSISIDGDDFSGKNSAYFNLRESNGKCYGYASLNFVGANDESTASLRIRMRPNGVSCELKDDLIFISADADVKYRTNQKAKRVFDYITQFGYIRWKRILTGEKKSYSEKENVIVMLTGDEVSIYSENFGVYNMKVSRFTYR